MVNGFSSFAVSQGRVCTLETRGTEVDPQEVCLAMDARTGTELWATNLGPALYDAGSGDGDGPRSTPAIADGRVFVLSAYLKLYCLSLANGQVLWSRDFMKEFNAPLIPWQNAASPVLDGGLVFLNGNAPDGTLAALRQSDGQVVWRAHADLLTHATPVPATIHDVRQLIFFTQSGLVSVRAADGELLWTHPVPHNGICAAASPVVSGDRVYYSATGSTGAGAVQLTREGGRFVVTELWRKPGRLRNYWSTPVCLGGYLYGLFESEPGTARGLRCVDLSNGETLWSEPGFVAGGVVLAGDRVLVLTEAGELVLAECAPFGYVERARAQVLGGKSWNVPAVCDGRIYARSTTEAVCLNAAVAQPSAGLMQSLDPRDGGRLCLRVASTDGKPIDTSRLERIEIRVTSQLTTELADWSRLTNNLILTNGGIEVDLVSTPGQLYFIAREQP